MSTRRRRRNAGDDEEHPDERWMASYMDMVTVLMCMFIVLFAMSTVDQEKFEQLRSSLATGFGAVETKTVDTAEGVVVPPELVDEQGEGFSDIDLAILEIEKLRDLQARIEENLEEKGLLRAVRFVLDERGLTMRLVSSETFFEPDEAYLTDKTVAVLNAIGPVLADTAHQVSVEGHTARLPDPTVYVLDWELSSERSVNVVRHLVDKSGVAGNHVVATGYGESRPLTPGTSAADLETNRRVDIIALSDQPESVRGLIHGLLAKDK